MLTRPWCLILLAFITLGCAHPPLPGPVIPSVKKITQTRTLPAFNQVAVEGQMNVILHTGYSRPQVILRGDPRDLARVITLVQNNTLLVSLGNGYPKFGAVTADIRGHYLNGFTYQGSGTISGSQLNTGLLDVAIDNPGRTTLGGHIGLRKLAVHGPGYTTISGIKSSNLQLTMTGQPHVQLAGIANISSMNLNGEGWFSMYWLKSDQLTIRAKGRTFVQLAGVVNKLDVELWNYAHFNGRYLRAASTFVKTHEHSIAEITTVDRQHTLATDASDIYFYDLPLMKADFMAYNGAVLDMRDWNMPEIKEYTRYNK